jgi:hypothetical protein
MTDIPQPLRDAIDLPPEHCYQHEGQGVLLLPTIVAVRDGEVTDIPVIPRTVRECQDADAEAFRNPGRRGCYVNHCNVAAASCRLSELRRITNQLRKAQVNAEFKRDPVATVNRMLDETLGDRLREDKG